MPTTSLVRNIPLDQLFLSPTNVRKVPASPAEEAELKASIRARGVLQNLLVHQSADLDEGFAVDAGGRRLKALQALASEGAIPVDHPVPCLVEEPRAALELSLTENTVRAAMHPADEFTAMAALIDGGEAIEAVATRFGVHERHVRQRLRLGKLAPKLLDQFRAGQITLDIVMAFTLGADHAAQLAVWRQVKDQHYLSAHTVRRLLTDSAVPADSDLALFVGVAAYEGAGGRVTRDLFEEEESFLDDAVLVRRLAIEKLEVKAGKLRTHWAWATAELEPDYGFTAQYGRVQPQPAEFSPDIAAELARIEKRMRDIEEMPEETWTEELAAESAQLSERYDELIETNDAAATFSPEDRAIAGCVVTVGEEGEFRIYEGLVDRALHPDAATRTSEQDDDDDEDGSGTGGNVDERPTPSSTQEQSVRKECGFSQSLVDDLKAYRQQITQAHLAGDFAAAFDLTLYALCVDLLDNRRRSHPLSLRATQTTPRSSLNDLAGTAADRLLQARGKALDTAWLSLPPIEGFRALSALPPESKHRLFAWCIAATLEAQLAIEDKAHPVLEIVGTRLAIPLAECWRPTAANYWGRVKKGHGLSVGEDVLGTRWARDHADDKKATLAAALATAFDPATSSRSIGLDQAGRTLAAAWLPPGMTYGDNAEAGTVIGGPAGDDLMAAGTEDGESDPTDLPEFLTDDEPRPSRLNGTTPPD